MSGKNKTEAWDRTLKAADQVKPLARSTGDAANRALLRTRAWAAPQLERTGHALEENVAPKMAAALSSAAKRIDPAKSKRGSGQWRLPVGIAAALAAAASAAAAIFGQKTRNARTGILVSGDGTGAAAPGSPAVSPEDSAASSQQASKAEGNGKVGKQ
jgi:hypothetical protein